ncbi:hypothetical protein ACHAW5_003122 [Stephanodiscus triporus]|uniref:Subtilisin n=1 Tax=Stephanodiscus triporus TaxID=2934178 RepID=A0ABD3QKQ3_9STRA
MPSAATSREGQAHYEDEDENDDRRRRRRRRAAGDPLVALVALVDGSRGRRRLDDAIVCPEDVLECPNGGGYLSRDPNMGCMFGDCPVVNNADEDKDAVAVAGDGVVDDGEVVGGVLFGASADVGVGDGDSFLAGSNNGTEGPGNDFVVVEHALNESAPSVVEARGADYDYDDDVDDSHRRRGSPTDHRRDGLLAYSHYHWRYPPPSSAIACPITGYTCTSG